MKQELIDKLEKREAVIGVIGLGYIGLPLALRYSEVGFRVMGFDTDAGKVAGLESGASHIEYIALDRVARARGRGFSAATDFSGLGEADALIICVPTPLNSRREPDLGCIIGAMDAITPHLRTGQVVCLESTTYPGTTEEELLPRVESAGLEVGRDVFLAYSPEREDPGNPDFTTGGIPKVVGGSTPACLEVATALYSAAIDRVVPVSSTRTAEMTKLLENVHRAVNIGLVNEMKIIADGMGIDIHEVIRAASTKPFGFTPYHPGPGLGGHCISIDPFYLAWKAREYGLDTRFIELAGEINTSMPRWVIGKLTEVLERRGMALGGAKVLVLGIAYKPNVDDMRESPAVELMELLRDAGAAVAYSDPHVAAFPTTSAHAFELASVELTPETIAGYDALLLATHHDAFDYALIQRHARLLVDTRGVYGEAHDNVVKA